MLESLVLCIALAGFNCPQYQIDDPVACHEEDSIPPVVEITNPLDHEFIQDTILVQATAYDNNNEVGNVVFLVDGIQRKIDYTAPYQWTFNTKSVNDGLHWLEARAHDCSGNEGVHGITIQVNNGPPSVQ